MPLKAHRLLGFAFASADLLIEIAPDGKIAFAMGASEALSGAPETALTERDWREFVHADDRRTMAMLLEGLELGRRAGPVVLRLATPNRAVSLTALTLPQNGGAISCALSQARFSPDLAGRSLPDRATFESLTYDLMEAARGTGKALELSLVELSGLTAARQEGTRAERKELEAQVAALLRAQTWGGMAATELENDRFAMVRASGESTEVLTERLEKLAATISPQPISASAGVMPLDGVERPEQHVLKALRYALDSFSASGAAWDAPADLSQALGRALDKALTDAGALGAAIAAKSFRLAYQPVVELSGQALHHYEVLVRFDEYESPFPQIRMAEEMDLIEALDFAILEKAVGVMRNAPALKLAVNVSGRTIVSERYIAQTLELIRRQPNLKGRLSFELTESAAIDDLTLANNHLQALRRAGCEVCLDDFGVGSASLAYLQQLHLDILKIDGRYIRDLQFGGRGSTFIKHLVGMCRELGMKTLAEMVETTAVEDEVRRAGVDFAQGWLYGLAADEPMAPAAKNVWKPLKVNRGY